MARTPKNYQGIQPTGRMIKDLLPKVLHGYEKTQENKVALIFEAWPSVVGEKLAPMTEVVSYDEGIVKIKVSNSTLLSVLTGHEKGKLLAKLRECFPSVQIKTLHFFIG